MVRAVGGNTPLPSNSTLVWRIWCSTKGGASDPALEELDSDKRRIANLELQNTWRAVLV